MTKFYSKTTGGFYDETIHGSRTIQIVDPMWRQPTVDDMSVVAPTIEASNPDCLMPADVVEITEAEHMALLKAHEQGKQIVANAEGKPIAVDPPPLTKVQIWDAIKAERDRRKAGGVKVGAKWFHSDDGSRIQQMSLVMMGASIPAGLQWKTMDGSFITMTQALAGTILATLDASDRAGFAAAETHRVAMEASADPAAYDYSGGWPKIYGE